MKAFCRCKKRRFRWCIRHPFDHPIWRQNSTRIIMRSGCELAGITRVRSFEMRWTPDSERCSYSVFLAFLPVMSRMEGIEDAIREMWLHRQTDPCVGNRGTHAKRLSESRCNVLFQRGRGASMSFSVSMMQARWALSMHCEEAGFPARFSGYREFQCRNASAGFDP